MAKLGSLQQNRRWQVPQQKLKGWQPNPGCQAPFSSRCPRQLVPANAVGRAGCPGAARLVLCLPSAPLPVTPVQWPPSPSGAPSKPQDLVVLTACELPLVPP